MIHILDGVLDATSWTCHPGIDTWQGDHLSCSMMNAATPALFTSGAVVGIVLQPHVPLLCSYSFDGGTMNKPRGGCGSWAGDPTYDGDWCTPTHTWECSWRPAMLREMMEAHRSGYHGGYNEVIVDGAVWNAHLPDGLAAFVYSAGAEGDARSKHGSFLSRFGKTACQVPLLLIDLSNGGAPFRGDGSC